MVKKRVKRAKKSAKNSSPMKKRKVSVLLNNLLLFIALSLVSLVLTEFSSNVLFVNLFSVLTIVFGFIAVAFLIVFLVLLLVRTLKK
ncbi:MAG: hypothetical protein WC511_04490 [Candidatus Pacearchaeota archaeon]